ncbi:MAG: ATP-binding cassette domain-containing protein [Thermoguttaceae bacterium]|nr:ATP-binding cassette domain-containing protein [Thermoguttaceae bacterium]
MTAIEGQVFVDENGNRKVLRRRRPLLEAKNLSVTFNNNHQVLRDINLKVRPGETVAIIGESGCGKTVFLKTSIGLIAPTSGKVLFNGKNLATLSSRELIRARSHYGFVFQQAALFDSMNIGENVAFPLRQTQKMKRHEIKDHVAHLLEEVGLNPQIMDRMPAELSGGMRKRVGFARALATEPDLMLYDEPTTGLDPIMSDVINELIIKARDNHHVTGVIITHDMNSAKKVANRIVMFYPVSRLEESEPQIIFDGSPDELEKTDDKRVYQFVNGLAGERLMEMAKNNRISF